MTAATRPDEHISRETWLVVASLMLSIFLVALDGTIVSTAMPSIVGSLGGFSEYAWVASVYLLAQTVSTPIYGKLADLFGRKRMLFIGIGLFLLGSITSGAAQSIEMLIVFRAIQGIGAGGVFPVSITIVGDLFSIQQRARVQGYFSSVWGVSALVGPLTGGFLVDNVGWRWIFYLNLPFGILALAMLWLFFHERPVHREHRLDIAGATWLTAAIAAAMLVLLEGGQSWPWFSGQSLGLAAASLIAFALFLRTELRVPEPVVPLNLFGIRIIAVSTLAGFFAGAVLIGVSFEVPLYVQGVLGFDALHAGFALAPLTLGWPIAASQSAKLIIRFGYRPTAAVGLAFEIVGTALLLTLGLTSDVVLVSAFSFLIGVGLGLSNTPLLIAMQSAVDWTRRGVVTGVAMFVRSFGSVVGLAIMGAIINNVAGAYASSSATNRTLDIHARHSVSPVLLAKIHAALFNGLHAAFWAALIAAIVGFAVVLRLPGGSATQHEAPEQTEEEVPTETAAAG